ncbi:hypothetical protein K474DRAFT_1671574 [Panus rudis PR-1116 ss-1]|nr:hypothetical protein K474DRAFT_1671574 [Panus rudis PR-1116 ss-1]
MQAARPVNAAASAAVLREGKRDSSSGKVNDEIVSIRRAIGPQGRVLKAKADDAAFQFNSTDIACTNFLASGLDYMSTSAYRLEAPRPRPPPLPLRTQNLNAKSSPSRISASYGSPPPLLYDLPPAITSSPTRSPGVSSPTSPTSRSRSRADMRMTPPLSKRAPTPSRGAPRNDLEEFAERCRAWYYDQDDNAGRLMTQTLATLPPSQRAPFARLQASIRSAYHASVNARRHAEFQARLSATQPGGSLMPHSRADPSGPLAQKERYERLERFVRTWCNVGIPGTTPFFQGLWAVMRLQVIPERLGGAGERRIEWEIDDAVFKEAAVDGTLSRYWPYCSGKDFMFDAIDVLKGVLGFDEVLSSKRPPSAPSSPLSTISRVHSRTQSQPLPSNSSAPLPAQKPPPITSTTTAMPKRARAPSDPFLDTPLVSGSYSSANTTAQLSTSASTIDDPPTPTTPSHVGGDYFSPDASSEPDEYLRTWTAPDLSDPEYLSLLKVFPSFVMRHPLPTFPLPKRRRQSDLEEGEAVEIERKEIRVGTGTMWLGQKTRSPGWQGSWWTRFKLWWKRIFC